MISNRTDVWQTDINLLNRFQLYPWRNADNSGNHGAQSNGATLIHVWNKEGMRKWKLKVNSKCTNPINLPIPWFDTNFHSWNMINDTAAQKSPSMVILRGEGSCIQATTCMHQEPIAWSYHLPYWPSESTLSRIFFIFRSTSHGDSRGCLNNRIIWFYQLSW